MQQISPELAARFGGEVTSLCLCWRLTRTDGVLIGITDHDEPLELNGLVYQPGASLSGGVFSQNAGLKPGRAAAEGVFSTDAISEEDIFAGLWNRARVDVFRVDWQRPDLGGLGIWFGHFSEFEQSETGVFEAELISLKGDLEKPVGRVFQRHCDAEFGDERCGFVNSEGLTCDRRFETCRDDYSNTENFRGFPHMPGMDFILSGPADTGNTGGKR
ncbi:MAG: DUF2163 domain-containing protein [Henriciella sp.]|nr:DUF2163 domain-containing protein [Henriciella sp.]